ncbi:TPA: glutamate--tRNA ligase [Candidatus Micrarchaeota archaeon]|nr:MAG: glutamate--tRNA ligase [Candidatus Micrarchaeota archaeon CG1_02_51_15]HII38515.1 glutamate--tRNA ligase [Candidatus Micrarchaeota archaeon]
MLDEVVRKHALKNAFDYGKAQPGSVIAKVVAELPDCKADMKSTMAVVVKGVAEVNALSRAQVESEVSGYSFPEKKQRDWLPELEWALGGAEVNTRIAPNPSGYAHMGHAKQAILGDEYARKYGGKFWLRFEDTDPRTKKPVPEFYELILEDLEWLGCKIYKVVKQSERLLIYYDYCERLMRAGKAYVCTCAKEEMQKNRLEARACACRGQSSSHALLEWKKMLDGAYAEGGAVVRIKTEVDHPNSSIRDWVMLRIVDEAHPVTGKKYRVWPLYNFAAAIDDHEMDITLVTRGKEHELNAIKQGYAYAAFGWTQPHSIETGVLKIRGGLEHKSDIRDAIARGELSGWDDPRAPTLRGMKARGIDPRAIRDYIISCGVGKNDSYLDEAKLDSFNRKYVERERNAVV